MSGDWNAACARNARRDLGVVPGEESWGGGGDGDAHLRRDGVASLALAPRLGDVILLKQLFPLGRGARGARAALGRHLPRGLEAVPNAGLRLARQARWRTFPAQRPVLRRHRRVLRRVLERTLRRHRERLLASRAPAGVTFRRAPKCLAEIDAVVGKLPRGEVTDFGRMSHNLETGYAGKK